MDYISFSKVRCCSIDRVLPLVCDGVFNINTIIKTLKNIIIHRCIGLVALVDSIITSVRDQSVIIYITG